jgi:capsular exopolysaccharide synthesis family protein
MSSPHNDPPFEFLRPSSAGESPLRESRTKRHADDLPFDFLKQTTTDLDDTTGVEFQLDAGQTLRRNKWLLVAGLIGGLVLGHAAFFKLGPEYNAVAQILVTRQVQVPVRESLAQVMSGEERGEHVAMIKSPMIIQKAIERGKLTELPTLRQSADPIDDILSALDVKRTAGHDNSTHNVFEIKYRNRQPADARAVVNAIILAYHEYVQEEQLELNSRLLNQVSRMDGELATRIEQKQKELLEFRRDAPLLWLTAPGEQRQPGDVTNMHRERVVDIERDRRANLLRRAEVNGKIRALQNAIDQGKSRAELEEVVRLLIATSQAATAGTATSANPLAGTNPAEIASAQLLPLLLEEQKLLRDFSDDHPDVANVRRSIARLQEFYEARGVSLNQLLGRDGSGKPTDLVAGYMQFLKQQLEEINFKDAELTQLFERENAAVKDLAKFAMEDQARSEELDRLKAQWNAIVNNLSHLDLTRDNKGYAMKVLAPVREEWSLKRYLKIVGAVMVLVMGLCLGLAFLREWRDTTVKTVAEIRKLLRGSQVLGSVPKFEVFDGPQSSELPLDPALCYFHRPASMEAESYRTVRTALLAQIQSGQRVLQVSSPEPGDGKSTFISNMAIALAQAGKRVLLLDADLRRPMIHQLFHARHEVGTTEVLSGEIELLNAVQESGIPNLWLLTSGVAPSNPAEILGLSSLETLLSEARREFDFILIDTPPLLAVSDPSVVARRVDGLLLVVRTHKNSRQALRQANQRIQTHGIPLLGVVSNAVEEAAEQASAYAGYYADYFEPRQASRSSVAAANFSPAKV